MLNPEACEAISLLSAWGRWLEATKLDNACLFGFQLLWWARAGKVFSAVAGLIILVDILGEDRIREFGERIYPKLLSKRRLYAISLFVATLATPSAILLFQIASAEYQKIAEELESSNLGVMFQLLLIGILSFVGSLLVIPAIPSWLFLISISITRTLAHPRVGTLLRVTSLAMFVIGFHFDLLGS